MATSQTNPTVIVILSRLRSATDVPLIPVVMPPPKRSDKPPPRLLCNKMNKANTTLVRMSTIDSVKIGHVSKGTTITAEF